MKKQFLIVLMILLTAGHQAMAEPRTAEQLKALALSALYQGTNGAKTRAEQSNMDNLEIVEQDEVLSVVADKEKGFVVLSNDDEKTPVLGYSFSSYDEANHAEGFLWWKEAAAQALSSQRARTRAATIPSGCKAEVEPFILTKWGQTSPWNDKCPLIDGERCVTGCVATAMAQVVYYYRYPKQGSGSKDGFDFASTVFEYGNMLHSYNSVSNTTQNESVATLLYACGVAVGTSFGVSASAASSLNIPTALKNYFGYGNPEHLMRSDYDDDAWMAKIYKELSNRRPIIYSGHDATVGGHEFIFDGYDKDGNVHVNWGWAGADDGYYNVDILKPDIMGGSTGFTNNQGMVINIRDYEEKPALITESVRLTGDRAVNSVNTLNASITNYDSKFNGKLYLFEGSESPSIAGCTPITSKSISIPSGASVNVSFDYTTTEKGVHYLWITTDAEGTDIVGKIMLKVFENEGAFLIFKDENASKVFTSLYDIDGDGVITYEEAASVTNLESLQDIYLRDDKAEIISLDELQYFTSLKTISGNIFEDCIKMKSVTLPSSINSIGSEAFYGCTALESIDIPNSVESIGRLAFNSSGLKSVKLPSSLLQIGDFAFANCNQLAEVTLPDNDIEIGDGAFQSCESLKSFNMGNGLTKFDMDVLYGCTAIENIQFSDGIEEIGNKAFYNMANLTNFTFGPNPRLKTIGDDAFYLCRKLKAFNMPNTVTSIGIRAFHSCNAMESITLSTSLTEIPDFAFVVNNSLKEIVIPEGVTSIGQNAFLAGDEDTALKTISLPSTLRTLTGSVFRGHDAVSDVYIAATTPPATGDLFGWMVYSNATLHVPVGTKVAYQAADVWKKFTNIVTIGFVIGDVNGDGSVNSADVEAVANHIMGKPVSGTFDEDAADVNGDGKVDAADIVGIVNIVKAQ